MESRRKVVDKGPTVIDLSYLHEPPSSYNKPRFCNESPGVKDSPSTAGVGPGPEKRWFQIHIFFEYIVINK